MAEVKTIKQYRTEQDGNTTIEIPIADEESRVVMEMNFRHYIDVLSDILVKYASNFKAGQAAGYAPVCKHKKKTVLLWTFGFCQYIYFKRKVDTV